MYSIEALPDDHSESNTYFPGRAGAIMLERPNQNKQCIGTFGILHPEVLNNFDIQYRYQLQIEDAELISNYQKVWFVDASHELYGSGFMVEEVEPKQQYSYTSHALPPSAIMQLCHEIYDSQPLAYLLGISGEDWGLRNGMSETAKERLELALEHFNDLLYVEEQFVRNT